MLPFSEVLRRAMMAAELDNDALARRLTALGHPTKARGVRAWRDGTRAPRPQQLLLLCTVLGITAEEAVAALAVAP